MERRIKRNAHQTSAKPTSKKIIHEETAKHTAKPDSTVQEQTEAHTTGQPETGVNQPEPGQTEKQETETNSPEQGGTDSHQEGTEPESTGAEQGGADSEGISDAITPDLPGNEETESSEVDAQVSTDGDSSANDDTAHADPLRETEIPRTAKPAERRIKNKEGRRLSCVIPYAVFDNLKLEADYWRLQGKKPHLDYMVFEKRIAEVPFDANSDGVYKIHPVPEAQLKSGKHVNWWLPYSSLKNLEDELNFNRENDTILETISQVAVNRLIAKTFEKK